MKQTTNFLFKTMVAQTSRKFSFTAFKLPDLGYDYNGLEPVISAPLLEVHHKKHHQAYVNNYNASVEQLLSSVSDPVKTTTLTNAIKFNGGGAINHAIFWTNLSPISKNGGILPRIDSVLGQGIVKNWGSFEKFIEEFSRRALAVQGSGWCCLGYNKVTNALTIQEIFNQDLLQATGLIPLLVIDVWEHAYYLQYKNMRVDFLKEIWKIVNWKNAEERLAEASK